MSGATSYDKCTKQQKNPIKGQILPLADKVK
jgi:hypothetical protein